MTTTPDKHPRQIAYVKRQAAKGLVRVSLWVPEDKRKAILKNAAKMVRTA